MGITIIGRGLKDEEQRTLDAVSPSTITISCLDRTRTENNLVDFVNEVLEKVKTRAMSSEHGQGHTTVFTTAVGNDEDGMYMNVILFGNYLSVAEDFYEIASVNDKYEVDVYYANDLLRMESIDQQYYDCEDIEFMDWVTFKPSSARAIKDVVDLCATWAHDRDICYLGDGPYTPWMVKAVCRKNKWKLRDFEDHTKWRLDDPRGPALWLLDAITEMRLYIWKVIEERDGTLRIGVKFECDTHDYRRSAITDPLTKLDEAARNWYRTLSV